LATNSHMKILTSKNLLETDEIIYADFAPEQPQACGTMPSRLVIHFRGKYVLTFTASEADELWSALKREYKHPLRHHPLYPKTWSWTDTNPFE
jgi:hypothetical protein